MNISRKFIRPLLAVFLGTLVASCGSESGAPTGSTIEFGPFTAKTWEYPVTGLPTTVDQALQVLVKGPNGRTINNVDLTLYLELSFGNVPTGAEAMAMYEDLDCDGIADTAAIPSGIRTTTGDFGRKCLVVRMAMGGGVTSYRGNLTAISGAASAALPFELKCVDSGGVTCN